MLISEHHVRECAYYIWENEGRIHGQAAAHWIRAEAELRANAMLAAAATVAVADAPKPAPAKTAAKPASAKPASAKPAASKPAASKPAAKPAAAILPMCSQALAAPRAGLPAFQRLQVRS